jgi:hypothetical protein
MVNPNKVGLVIGSLIGGWHLVWSFLILLHWAQPILDFIFWAHMIRPVYIVKSFDPAAAVTLVIMTAAFGYIVGLFGAVVWNKLHRR